MTSRCNAYQTEMCAVKNYYKINTPKKVSKITFLQTLLWTGVQKVTQN